MKVLLKNALTVDPQIDLNSQNDILIENGIIAKIEPNIKE